MLDRKDDINYLEPKNFLGFGVPTFEVVKIWQFESPKKHPSDCTLSTIGLQ